jgi:nucleoside-diphosphate-sugar epimerase
VTRPRCALITGATGFIGSHLARRLIDSGWVVHALVRQQSNLDILKDREGAFTAHVHDGTMDRLCRILEETRPDIVFHVASLFLAEHGPEDILPLVNSNLAFPTMLLEAMAKSGSTKLVNTGTSWQQCENGKRDPVNLYAATKEAFEDIIRYYAEAAELKAVTLVLYDSYGPGDKRRKLINLLLKTLWTGEPLIMSPGDQRIDLVHVDDVVEAYLTASEHLLTHRIEGHERYAVTTGQYRRLRDIVALLEGIAGQKLPIRFGGRPYRKREVMDPWCEERVLPGWKPRIPLESGLADLVLRETEP